VTIKAPQSGEAWLGGRERGIVESMATHPKTFAVVRGRRDSPGLPAVRERRQANTAGRLSNGASSAR
jgi:hypothetical protein